MTSRDPPPEDDSGKEISVLIKALRDADQRLDEFTAGAVDTVADREGHSFTLQRAQGELRSAEAAKHASILNALPAHIVLLDARGIIISVNAAWRQTSLASALINSSYGEGVDYLAACEAAVGANAADARRLAGSIRAVLDGSLPRASFEYPIRSGKTLIWNLVNVTPLNADRPNGAVVMHLNITDQKRVEARSRRFGIAMDTMVDAVYLVDRSTMQFIHLNEGACRMQGRTREVLMALTPSEVLGVPQPELEASYDELIAGGVEAKPVELHSRRPDGSFGWVEVRRRAQQSEDGWMIVSLVRDITDRKLAENRIAYLNRVYAMLSELNVLIVRENGRDELFKSACQIAVDTGGFALAMIGVVDAKAKRIVNVGLAGSDESLCAIARRHLAAAAGVPSKMTASAIDQKHPVISNRSQDDTRVAVSETHREFGVRSMAVFPLLVADRVVGVISLYAKESQFFHAEEMKLLTELTNDIAFAIDHIEKRERLDYIAYYDVLTGLPNRKLFLERTTQALQSQHGSSLILIDLQRFRNINDSLGRAAGDTLLRQVAAWFKARVGEANLVARVGVDQFALLLPEIVINNGLAHLVEEITKAFLSHSFVLDDVSCRVAAKVGIVLYPEDGTDADTLLNHAEAALKKAKSSGDRYVFYTQKMTASVAGKLSLENKLHRALDNGEFVLYYQPKVNLVAGIVSGVEALIRWNDPHSGLVLPGDFIPILEETGLIHEVGRWALGQAIEDYLYWQASGFAPVRIAVNVSALQLRSSSFVREIEQAVGKNILSAAGLELEITESLIMEDIEQNIVSLRAIRAMGVKIAIDDFGTGFSSLSYLAKLPVNTLKVDRSFINDMITGPEGLILVSTIVKLAHSLNLNVVAEGVETEQQSRLLRLLKCDEMQGYLVTMPVPREAFELNYLNRREERPAQAPDAVA